MWQMEGVSRVDVDIKAATRRSARSSRVVRLRRRTQENMMEITIQGDLVHDLAEACNALYDVRVVVSR